MSQCYPSIPSPIAYRSAVCYTPEFRNTKNSGLANKSYITMIKRYSTNLLGKVENHCISQNQGRQAKLGYHSSKKRMQSYMATIRICWEAWNAMGLRISLGTSYFFYVSCQETNVLYSAIFQRCFDCFAKQGNVFYIIITYSFTLHNMNKTNL